MSVSVERLAELRALIEAATPGPWQTEPMTLFPGSLEYPAITRGEPGADDWACIAETGYQRSDANAALIVAAVNSLPDLVGEIERLQAIETAARKLRAIHAEADTLDSETLRWVGKDVSRDIHAAEAALDSVLAGPRSETGQAKTGVLLTDEQAETVRVALTAGLWPENPGGEQRIRAALSVLGVGAGKDDTTT